MARISTYPIDQAISGSDRLIGSDAGNRFASKNFTINRVAEFLNSANKIEHQGLKYKYQDYQIGDDREYGTIQFEVPQSGKVDFSTLTGFMVSEETISRQQVATYYSAPLVDSIVLISRSKNPSDWAVIKWLGVSQNVNNPKFYDVDIEVVSSNGGFESDELYFVSLLQLSVGDYDKNYIHVQNNASSVWTVNHNLNKKCSVTVTDSAGTQVQGDVQHVGLNQVVITFSAAFSGEAFCN